MFESVEIKLIFLFAVVSNKELQMDRFSFGICQTGKCRSILDRPNILQMNDGSKISEELHARIQQYAFCGNDASPCIFTTKDAGFVYTSQGWEEFKDATQHPICKKYLESNRLPFQAANPCANTAISLESTPQEQTTHDWNTNNIAMGMVFFVAFLFLVFPKRSWPRKRVKKKKALFSSRQSVYF